MPGDPYYRSVEWVRLRAGVLERDRHACTVAGCGAPAVVVDHIKARRHGGANDQANLRSLCRAHDNQLKEARDGRRRSGGVAFVRGSDEQGRSLDPNHPWTRGAALVTAEKPANRLLQLFGRGGG